jgi:4'-phosphopantetheinyl transferase EntD
MSTSSVAGVPNTLQEQLSDELGVKLTAVIATEPVSTESLLASELLQLQPIHSAKRIESWLLGRAALKNLLRNLGLDTDTSLLSFPHSSLSLSHTANAAIAVCVQDDRVSGVGVDIERKRDMNPKSGRFFLLPDEQAYVDRVVENLKSNELLRLWTLKESLFKADSSNKRKTLKEYFLFNASRMSGLAAERSQPTNPSYRYASLTYDHFFIAAAVHVKSSAPMQSSVAAKRTTSV